MQVPAEHVLTWHGVQLPFRNAKFDILVDEPGLGGISGCRITIKTQACPHTATPWLLKTYTYVAA